ncbi:MAG: LOG family protein, partial [Planctomycetota bacterium]
RWSRRAGGWRRRRTTRGPPRFGRTLAEAGWMVITGAGDGIMRAGHAGSGKESAFGVAIRLPFETNANDVIVGDPKLITFRYFFTRKLMFMWMSHAIALFPGGFGTQDEGFEALTLIQTGKAPLVPIVMVDAPGGDYWHHWDNYVTKSLLDNGWISPEDKNLYFVTDDVSAAARHITDFYRNYHSQRFVRDNLVLRIRRPLTDKQLDQLAADYADLIVEGKVEQGGPLPGERDHLQLPRLWFHHTKAGYGKLRGMIDQINTFDIENSS